MSDFDDEEVYSFEGKLRIDIDSVMREYPCMIYEKKSMFYGFIKTTLEITLSRMSDLDYHIILE